MTKRSILISPKGLSICVKAKLRYKADITNISKCENLVPASPHTALGETSVHTPWIDVERAINVGIFLAN